MSTYTLLQVPPKVQVGQYWRGYDANPEFNRRKICVLNVENERVLVGFCDTIKTVKGSKSSDETPDYQETCTLPESMFSNILTGYVYFSTDNKKQNNLEETIMGH